MTKSPDRPRALDRLLDGINGTDDDDVPSPSDAVLVGDVLRNIRVLRRKGVGEVADAMQIGRRSYENLEAGRARLSYDRIERFARAIDADPVAILATIVFRSPEAALNAVDNKLFLIAFLAAAELLDELGSDIERLDTRTIITAFDQITKNLTEVARRRDTFVDDWVSQRTQSLGMSLGKLFSRKMRS